MEEQTPKASQGINKMIVLAGCAVIFVLCTITILIGVIFYLLTRTPVPDPGLKPEPLPNITTIITKTPQPQNLKGTITGNLSFPSEYIPELNVCAQDVETMDTTCVFTEENATTYEIEVTAAQYYIYATDGDFIAYYTRCDTDLQVKCNDESWYYEDFVCYNDTACSLAFTPYAAGVSAGGMATGINIMQGWYLPCSGTCDTGTDENDWMYYFQ